MPDGTVVPFGTAGAKKLADSLKEYKRWLVLCDDQRRGRINGLQGGFIKRCFPLHSVNAAGVKTVITRYYPDAVYIRDGKLVVEDTKGYATEMYKLKKKMMKAEYGIDIEEVK